MKTTLYILIILLIGLNSCDNNKANSREQLQAKMKKAIDYVDYYTAIYYAHELLALDAAADSTAIQLAELYNVTQNTVGAIKLADELLPKVGKEEQVRLWLIKATSFENARNYPKAIAAYEQLASLDPVKEVDCLYEIGVLFFQGKDIENGIKTMQKVVQHPDAKTRQTTIRSDWGEDKVSYYLAALNYIGYVYIETKKYTEAETIYAEINQSGTPFKLAKGNQQLLVQRKAKSKK